MVALVRVIRLVHILLPVHYTPRVALYPRVRYFHCLDGMTLWLSFGSYELGLVLPLVCVSRPSPATYWILQSLSLRYGNGRLSESYQACPCSVTSVLHS